MDNRYAEEAVVSHNGPSVMAKPIAHSTEIFNYLDQSLISLLLMRCNFLMRKLSGLPQHLANSGYRVILAGLDQDFRGEPFGPMPALLSLAESVTKLQAVCAVCGSPSSRTQRLIDGSQHPMMNRFILVGASESYEPRCRHHHEVPG